ncbi:MAG TPA: hypothetical protein VHM70_24610, partial [Polyangiaceae bacterium]|nr:hypothetical protein [Polyangiaceae bacterium]
SPAHASTKRAKSKPAKPPAKKLKVESMTTASNNQTYFGGQTGQDASGNNQTYVGGQTGQNGSGNNQTYVGGQNGAPGGTSKGGTSESAGALPASAADINDAMLRAYHRVQDLKIAQLDQQHHLDLALAASNDAVSAARAAVNDALGIVEDRIVHPLETLKSMLGDLVRHPDKLFDPSTLVDDQTRAALAVSDEAMTEASDAIQAASMVKLTESEQHRQQLESTAAETEVIVAAMSSLAQEKTTAALLRLNALLPSPGGNTVGGASGGSIGDALPGTTLKPNAPIASLNLSMGRARAQNVSAAIRADLTARLTEYQQLRATKPTLDSAARARVTQDCDTYFNGKSRSEAKKQKATLESQARKRFAGDSATLKKVLALIEREYKARVK